jgi:hypothetical protein
MRRLLLGLAIAGACASAGCQQEPISPIAVLARGEGAVTSIAVDAGYVYWARGDGTIKRVSLDTGAIDTLTTGPKYPNNLTVDQAHLFWSAGSSILRVAKTGGTMDEFAQNNSINRLSLDDQHIYWTTQDTEQNNVNQITKEGVFVQSLASAVNPTAVLGGRANVLFGATSPQTSSNVVNQVPVQGGAVNPLLFDGTDEIAALATDTAAVYWGTRGATPAPATPADVPQPLGSIKMAALDGSNIQVVASGEPAILAVVADSTNLFWSNGIGQVRTAPILGGAPMSLIEGPVGPVSVAVDVTNVYWANGSDDGIFTAPKP